MTWNNSYNKPPTKRNSYRPRSILSPFSLSSATHQGFVAQLASSQDLVDSITAQTLGDANVYLETAQELGLIRDSLSDELSYLSGELVSSMSGPDRQPTLLEDLETLQRNLKELESVKDYVQVIHRALFLRCERSNNLRFRELMR